MKIKFLGTGAPEGNPSPFCVCKNCKYARIHKKKNIRLQASLFINSDLLLDFGSDIRVAVNNLGISLAKVKYILVTHCHFDHWYAPNLIFRSKGPRMGNIQDLTIFGPSLLEKLARGWIKEESQVKIQPLNSWEDTYMGDYIIHPFPITQRDKFAGKGMGYIINQNKKLILYAVDTYKLPDDLFIKWKSISFDIIILDETFGLHHAPLKDHMYIASVVSTVDKLRKNGNVSKKTKIYIQHMSHHNPPHDKLVSIMRQYDIVVPYDGLVINI